MPFSRDAKIAPGKVLRRTALIFVPIAAVLALVILLGVRIDGRFRRDVTELREQSRVNLAGKQIAEEFRDVDADLRLVANLPSLRAYLDTGSPEWRSELSQVFWHLSREKQRYDQIRYLDDRGREIIRVNFNGGTPALVPRAELQDKSDRYYFRDAIRLSRGEAYVSPLDLNIEHNQLEVPHKPMIRFATPVFDSAGRKKGVVVFNYFGDDLLQRFREVTRGGPNVMLLNREGYWLVSADPANEWGFMLDRPDRTFGHDFPEEWQAVSTGDSGSLVNARGLFVYATVYPLLAKRQSLYAEAGETARAYRWKVVSYVPSTALAADSYFRQPGIEIVVGAVYMLLAIAAWLIAQVTLSRKETRLALAYSNARYDELTRSIPVGVYQFRFRTDGSYAFDYVSPVFCHILGLHEALVMADAGTAFSAAHPDDADVLIRANREAATLLKPFRWEGRFIVRGETRWLRIASDPTQYGDWGSLWSGVVTDITEQKALEHELARQAHIDMLTGLGNRRHFFELAEKELARARRHHEPLAILMLDVDYFKQFNDTYGHDVGDRVLRKMGEICTGVLRGNDVLGRLGGEEFAALLPETAMEAALETAERLRAAVADAGMELAGGKLLHFTVSIGAACLTPGDENIDAVLKRADAALYAAKDAGRNCVCAG